MTHVSATIDDIRRAIETRNASTLKALYDTDAVVTIIDRDNPPSRPRTLRGAAEIGKFLDDVYGRDMTHTLDEGMLDDNHLAFVEGCTYPDGSHVIASTMAELGPNGIVRQVIVQAWDG